ncbi:tetratricopeptide repeat protein [Alteromonas sp. BL110]|uniref:tetratricopeptide repeat protein n=1 Tax=Alteromonas sp. BL110 TaxID=1714845 RepID=UPI000E4E3AA7|nr:tetratricopeptide repeat protein [Alteromonas sp. BL110]AXT38316.1 tetratricopeptide repeat protein [Alteromonas sp. BL110]RKM83940.1 tetratricopeptide repeat protein [Alteromonas sp. BL110]
MSILNDTLKSLDERNQSEDFGLPPTVHVANRSIWPKALILLIVLGLVIWLVLSIMTGPVDSNSASNTGSTDTVAKVDIPDTAASPIQNERIETDSESTSKQDVDSAEHRLEGMKSTPLSEQDLANQNTPSDVAEIVFNSIDETVADDEAEYRQRTQVASSSSLNSNTQSNKKSDKKATEVEDETISAANISVETEETGSAVVKASGLTQENANIQTANKTNVKTIGELSTSRPESIISRQPTIDVTPKSPAQQSAIHLEAGLKAYNFGIFDEAQKSFTLALSTYPQNIEARKQLAALYFGQNNNLQALQVLSEGVVMSPESLVWRELMAKILVQESRFEEVLNLMPDSLDAKALAEKRIDYLILKGTSAQTVNKPEQAISAFSAMTSLQPNNAKWWLALGVNYDALSDKRLAISSYSKALAIGDLSSTSSQYASARLTDLQEQP